MCDVLIIKKMYVWNFSRCLFNSSFPPGVVVLPLKERLCFRPCPPCSERNLRIKLKIEEVDQFYNSRTQMAQAEETDVHSKPTLCTQGDSSSKPKTHY